MDCRDRDHLRALYECPGYHHRQHCHPAPANRLWRAALERSVGVDRLYTGPRGSDATYPVLVRATRTQTVLSDGACTFYDWLGPVWHCLEPAGADLFPHFAGCRRCTLAADVVYLALSRVSTARTWDCDRHPRHSDPAGPRSGSDHWGLHRHLYWLALDLLPQRPHWYRGLLHGILPLAGVSARCQYPI